MLIVCAGIERKEEGERKTTTRADEPKEGRKRASSTLSRTGKRDIPASDKYTYRLKYRRNDPPTKIAG